MGDVASIGTEAFRNVHTNGPEVNGEVLTGPERRRRWSTEEKLRVLAQSVAPGSSPTLVCRTYGISRGQLSTWRKQFRAGNLTGFVPVSVVEDRPPPELPAAPIPSASKPAPGGMIEVELPSGVKLRVTGDVGETALRRVLSALS